MGYVSRLSYILLISSFIFYGCSDHHLSPQAPEAGIQKITILRSADLSLQKEFVANQVIDSTGGTIVVGDSAEGYSKLIFPENAIDTNGGVPITFRWQSEGLLEAYCSPHGLQFAVPVYIRLSYKNADLTDVDEDELGIYYQNEWTGMWELVSDYVNQEEKYVEGHIHHFSRYAIGMD